MIDVGTQLAKQNSLINQSTAGGMPTQVLQAIKAAAQSTGVDFSYLVNKASQESGFDANAKSSSSSATGLYQFTGQTWLDMVKKYGAQYGLTNYANHITLDSSGVAHVDSTAMKQTILNLRKDPAVSALMAGELDKENMASLQQSGTGKVGATELYLAHFLGAGGASDFLTEMKHNAQAAAATVLPEAAASNPSVFYNADGQPKTLGQIYQHFAQKFDRSTSAVLVANTSSSTSAGSYMAAAAYNAASNSGSLSSGTASGSPVFAASNTAMSAGSGALVNTMILAQQNLTSVALQSLIDERDAFDRNPKKTSDTSSTPLA